MGVRIRGARGLIAAAVAAAALLPAAPAFGAQRALITVELGQSRTAQFPGVSGNNPAENDHLVQPTPADCTGTAAACDDVPIRVGDPRHDPRHTYVLALQLSVSYTPSVDTVDVYLWDNDASNYQLVGAANNGANPELLTATVMAGALYHLVVVNGAGPNTGYQVVARLSGYQAAVPDQSLLLTQGRVDISGDGTAAPGASKQGLQAAIARSPAPGARSPGPTVAPLQVGSVAAEPAPADHGSSANVALVVAVAAPVGIAIMLWWSSRRRPT